MDGGLSRSLFGIAVGVFRHLFVGSFGILLSATHFLSARSLLFMDGGARKSFLSSIHDGGLVVRRLFGSAPALLGVVDRVGHCADRCQIVGAQTVVIVIIEQ